MRKTDDENEVVGKKLARCASCNKRPPEDGYDLCTACLKELDKD
jgi:hypothetical protein